MKNKEKPVGAGKGKERRLFMKQQHLHYRLSNINFFLLPQSNAVLGKVLLLNCSHFALFLVHTLEWLTLRNLIEKNVRSISIFNM